MVQTHMAPELLNLKKVYLNFMMKAFKRHRFGQINLQNRTCHKRMLFVDIEDCLQFVTVMMYDKFIYDSTPLVFGKEQ